MQISFVQFCCDAPVTSQIGSAALGCVHRRNYLVRAYALYWDRRYARTVNGAPRTIAVTRAKGASKNYAFYQG